MPRYSDDELQSHLRAVNEEYHCLPTIDNLGTYNERAETDLTPHYQTYVSRFDSWTGALEHAFPDPELCRELWRVANQLDRRPYKDDLENRGRFGLRAYRQRFGSWEDALIQAEFDPSIRIPTRFLIADLRRIADLSPVTVRDERDGKDTLLMGSLSTEKIENRGKYSFKTYHERFRSKYDRCGSIILQAEAGIIPPEWFVDEIRNEILTDLHRKDI